MGTASLGEPGSPVRRAEPGGGRDNHGPAGSRLVVLPLSDRVAAPRAHADAARRF